MRFIDFRYPPFILCLLCPHSSNTKHRIIQDCGNCNFPVSDFYLIFFLLYQLAEIYELIIITFQSCAMPNFGEGFGIKKNQNYDASFLSINKKWLPFTELNNSKQLFICWFARKITWKCLQYHCFRHFIFSCNYKANLVEIQQMRFAGRNVWLSRCN